MTGQWLQPKHHLNQVTHFAIATQYNSMEDILMQKQTENIRWYNFLPEDERQAMARTIGQP